MPTPDQTAAALISLLPMLLIAGIVALHWGYWYRHRAADTQQHFGLVDLTAGDAIGWTHDRLPDRTVLEGDGALYGPAIAPHAALAVPCGASAAQSVQLLHATWRAPDGLIGRPIVSTEDVIVGEASVFLGAIKVVGDLVVDGHGVFLAPVVVDGHVRVAGLAEFRCGLLVKSDAHVSGTLTIGDAAAPSWVVVQHLTLDGSLLLHGRIVANDGFIEPGRRVA